MKELKSCTYTYTGSLSDVRRTRLLMVLASSLDIDGLLLYHMDEKRGTDNLMSNPCST